MSEFKVKTIIEIEADYKKAINEALDFKSAMKGYLTEFKNARKEEKLWIKQRRMSQKLNSEYNFSIQQSGKIIKWTGKKFRQFGDGLEFGNKTIRKLIKGSAILTGKSLKGLTKGTVKLTKSWAKFSLLKPLKLFKGMTKGVFKASRSMGKFAIQPLKSFKNMAKLSGGIKKTEKSIGKLTGLLHKFNEANDTVKAKKVTRLLKKQNKSLKGQKMALGKAKLGWTFLAAAATGAMMWMISSSPALNAQLGIMKQQFGLIGMTLGNVMAPAFQFASEKVIEFTAWFMELDPIVHEAIVVFTLVTLALSVFAVAAFIGTSAMIGFLVSIAPFILIIAGITALILIIMHWDEVMKKLTKIFDGTNQKLKAFVTILIIIAAVIMISIFGPFLLVIGIVILLYKNFDKLKEITMKVFSFISGVITGFWKTLKDTFLVGDILDIFTDMFSVVGEMVNGIIDMFANIGTGIVAILTGDIDTAMAMAKEVFMAPVKLFGSGIKLFLSPMRTVMDKIAGGPRILGGIRGKAKNLRNTIDDVIAMIPSFAVGTRGLPQDMVIQAHKGEIIVPSGASKEVRAGRALIGGGGGMATAMGGRSLVVSPTIYLQVTTTSNAEETAMIAKDLIMRDMERLVSRG